MGFAYRLLVVPEKPNVDRLGAGAVVLLAVATGILYAMSMAPLAWWPAGWIALAPLCIAAAGSSPGWAALTGLLAGSLTAAFVSPWLPAMVADYFQAPGLVGVLASALAWILSGGVSFALFAGWLAWALARGPVPPLLVGAGWWLCEWVRAHGIPANPWALLGYSQMEWPLAAQIADLAGPYGVGAALVAVASGVAGGIVPGLRGRRPLLALGAVLCVVVAQLAYGAAQLQREEVDAPSLSVALVQGAIPQAARFDAAHLDENLTQYLSLTRRAAEQGADLVVWPELAMDFYVDDDVLRRRRVERTTEELGIVLLSGGLGARLRDGEARRTNAVFLLHEGRLRDRYDKVRLVPFAEEGPFSRWFGGEGDPILAGDALHLLRTPMADVGVATCSEAMHPDYVAKLVAAGAELLVAPSNDDWFGDLGAARQQLHAVSMRAIESRRFLLRPTTSGLTALVDPSGRVVDETPPGEPALLLGRVGPATRMTLYSRVGDATAWLPLLLVGGDAWARSRRRTSTEVSR